MQEKQMTPPPAKAGSRYQGAPVVKPKNMHGTLMRLWALTKGQRQGLGLILFLSALTSASAVLSPLLIGNVISLIYIRLPAGRMLALLLILYTSNWLIRFLQQFFMASTGQRMILQIRTLLFDSMKQLPLSYFDRHRHGELMSRLTNDVDNISTTISDSLAQLMIHGFTILGVFFMMLRLNILLTGLTFLPVLLVFIMTRTITRRTRKLFARQQQILGKLNGQVEESISGLSVVKAFHQEAEMIRQFEESNEELCLVATQAQIWSGFLMPLTNVINNFSYVFMAIVSGILAAQGQIPIGMISSFLLYSKQFARPFVDIANTYNQFQTAIAGAERILEIFDEQPEPTDKPEALSLTAPKGDITFSHVTFGYIPGQPVLKDLNLTIPAGTRVAIVGSTGSGKTTFINLLTRFYDVEDGSILLDGQDLRDYRTRDLRKAFGVVLQDTSLFDVSVQDNIRFGNWNASLERVKAAAAATGADGFIQRLPKGYDTELTQGGSTLSQGERQLITIARTVLADAPILILDEATSSVDTLTEQKIRQAILSVSNGRTSFMIAHRLSTIRDSDLILLLENGQIAEQGSHRELIDRNGGYAALYRTQIGQKFH